MDQEELVDYHLYIEKLPIDEVIKEVCRGIMFARYWNLHFKDRGLEITDYTTKQLIDMVANNAFTPPASVSG